MPKAYQENPKARMWLWIGVGVTGSIILVLWAWATSISLSSFKWSKTPENKLIKNSQNDWETLFNDEKSKIKTEQTKLQIKNMLNTIIAQINSESSTTSTIVISTTTTPTSSSFSTNTTTK
ncbi:MAG TPA: hypothetical protein VLK22_03475 [Candidatus Udaeobacter sp.]|nr:hypothetical protein [Candidatus Udaeobacter sp.]